MSDLLNRLLRLAEFDVTSTGRRWLNGRYDRRNKGKLSAEGIEARLANGHLSRVQPLVNPIRRQDRVLFCAEKGGRAAINPMSLPEPSGV